MTHHWLAKCQPTLGVINQLHNIVSQVKLRAVQSWTPSEHDQSRNHVDNCISTDHIAAG